MFNRNAAAFENTPKEGVSTDERESEHIPEKEEIPKASADTTGSEKAQDHNDAPFTVSNMDDHAFRQALRSLHVTEKKTDDPPQGQMKDDDFRKALQTISRKESGSDE